jgi:hypothetical protein
LGPRRIRHNIRVASYSFTFGHPCFTISPAIPLTFLVPEIIISHVESPPQVPDALPTRSLSLSRTLTTPNIRAKGALESREVEVPDFGQFQESEKRITPGTATNVTPQAKISAEAAPQKKPLIEELPAAPSSPAIQPQKPKSILKKSADSTLFEPAPMDGIDLDPHVRTEADAKLETPIWRWDRDVAKGLQHDKLIVETPKFVRVIL